MTETSSTREERTASHGDTPIIVAGLPRSGTSMMMQILDAGGVPVLTDHARKPDEDNPRGYYELEAVKRLPEDASWLEQAGGKVVKMVYRLLYDLPLDRDYRVIFMKRRLAEVIASQEEMLQRSGKPSGDVDAASLADIYERQLRDVQVWLSSHPNFRVLYVDYHDVVSEPERTMREIDEFLGGGLDEASMARAPDRSLYRQRQ